MATSSFDKKIVITKQAAKVMETCIDKPVEADTKVVKTSSKLASKAVLAKRAKLR